MKTLVPGLFVMFCLQNIMATAPLLLITPCSPEGGTTGTMVTNTGNGLNMSFVNVSYPSENLSAPQVFARFKPSTVKPPFSGNLSDTVGTADLQNMSATEISINTYCEASTTWPSTDMGINRVVFNTIDNTTGDINLFYNDFTAISTNVVKGQLYPLSVNGWGYESNCYAWFDWNNDGDFDDVGEAFYIAGWSSNYFAVITIPSDATTGNVRMRVRTDLWTEAVPPACGAVLYGECEDYTVNVESVGPILFATPSNVDFGYTSPGSTSTEMTYTLSGFDLSPVEGNLTVTPPANFEVSLTSGSGFGSSAITIPYTSGTLPERTVYVRFHPSGTNAFSDNITNSGGNAAVKNVTVTGTSICSASTDDPEYMGIQEVIFNTIDNNTGTINQGYNEFTGISTTVVKNQSYTLSVYGWGYNQFFKAWLDWNNDGDFADSGEEFSIGSYGYSSSASISIPLGATTGNVRMRIRSNYQSAPLPLACGSVDYGECEDYTIVVEDAAAIVWDGSESTNWNTPANWSSNSVPTINDNVRIPVTGSDPIITLNIGANSYNLNVEANAKLTVQSGGSLITNGTITNLGTIDIQRTITKDRWHLISSPVVNAKANIFKDDYLQSWDEGSATWADIVSAETVLNPSQGYGLWTMYPTDHTYTFTGTPNTGNQSIGLSSIGTGGTYNGANLLGNPYPSSIDWSMLYNTYGAVYYWVGNGTNGDGTYVSWNNGTGPTNGQYIAPMQGFFVVSANETFALTNDNRVHSNSLFYKSADGLKDNLIILETISKGISDKLYVNLNADATKDFDLQYDAYKFASGTPGLSELYSFAGEKKLSIDVRPACEVIQLGFSNSLSGDYQIGISQINGIADAILEDTETGTFTDLQKDIYSFNYIAGEPQRRFNLHFGTLGIINKLNATAAIYSFHKTAHINLNSQVKGDIFIYNIAGQLIATKLSANGMNEISLNNMGNYIVKVVTDKTSQVKKIFIQ